MPRFASPGRLWPVPRRPGLAALGLAALLPGCANFNDFLADTFSYDTNPNLPVGQSENLRRVQGVGTEIEPLAPEAGNVWPDGVQSMPTLQDLERETNQAGSTAAPPPDLAPYLPDHRQPRPIPGSSSPQVLQQPGLATPANGGVQPRPPSVARGAPPTPATTALTPNGPETQSGAGGIGGYKTLTTPQGSSIVVPNGNGTSTVIKPDGTVETIQTPGR